MDRFGTGSGWIRISLPDPDRYQGHTDLDLVDRDRYQFQANEKLIK